MLLDLVVHVEIWNGVFLEHTINKEVLGNAMHSICDKEGEVDEL